MEIPKPAVTNHCKNVVLEFATPIRQRGPLRFRHGEAISLVAGSHSSDVRLLNLHTGPPKAGLTHIVQVSILSCSYVFCICMRHGNEQT